MDIYSFWFSRELSRLGTFCGVLFRLGCGVVRISLPSNDLLVRRIFRREGRDGGFITVRGIG